MCFLLYAGTARPLPRSEWRQESPAISVQPLRDEEDAIRAHFGTAEVQHIGSTSCCGCDFPNLIYQNGGWPAPFGEELTSEPLESDRFNRDSLAALLESSGEEFVELYGIWAGDFAEEPRIREEISIEVIRRDDFHFKERGFYRVTLR